MDRHFNQQSRINKLLTKQSVGMKLGALNQEARFFQMFHLRTTTTRCCTIWGESGARLARFKLRRLHERLADETSQVIHNLSLFFK